MAILSRSSHKLALILLFSAVVLFSLRANAQDLQLYEQKIKAGLIYNFLKYTEWPTDKSGAAPLNVCVFGEDPFDGYLQPMDGRTVNQRLIRISHIHKASDAVNCHMLFVNADESGAWADLHKAIEHKSVLTVSDFPGFVDKGGMIQLDRRNSHIIVELNIDAVTAAHLNVYNSLLKLVTITHNQPQGD